MTIFSTIQPKALINIHRFHTAFGNLFAAALYFLGVRVHTSPFRIEDHTTLRTNTKNSFLTFSPFLRRDIHLNISNLVQKTFSILHYARLTICKVHFRVRQRLHRFSGSLFRIIFKVPWKWFVNFYPATAQAPFHYPAICVNRSVLLIISRSPQVGADLQFFISLLMKPRWRLPLRYDHSGATVLVFAPEFNGFSNGVSRPFETKTYRLFYLPRPPCK